MPEPSNSGSPSHVMPSLLVAIDGPSGAGKTTVGLLLARRLEALFLDTGLFYRALTALALERSGPISDGASLAVLVSDLEVTIPPGGAPVSVGLRVGQQAAPAVASEAVEAHVSEVSAHPAVRAALLPLQRDAARADRVVAVGRDVGTVVFPEAHVKIYLDASLAERTRRRAAQVGVMGPNDSVGRALAERDALDSGRAVAPLTRAPDAIEIWNDIQSPEEVVERMYQIVALKAARR